MSKIVKYTEFKRVVDDLWSKVKTNFVTDITYSSTDKKLKKTKNGAETEITKIVTEWQDLEHTTQSTNYNIFNPSTFEDGKYYAASGLLTNPNWGNFKIVCNPGDTFTLFKKQHDSVNIALLNGNTWVQNLSVSRNNDNGWVKYTINVPQGVTIDRISIPVHKLDNNYKSDIMLFSSDVNAPDKYIPFTNSRVVSIDGSKVALTFDPTGSSLKSSTTYDAIKELDGKIASAGGGTVTSVNNQQPTNGNVAIDGTHINATVGGTNTTIQDHLTTINNNLTTAENSIRANSLKANSNENRILVLERKHPVYHVGDIVTTVYKDSNTYVADDFEFLYIGASRQLINRDKYGDLFNALGVNASVNSIYAPEISDINLTYNINQTAKRRHYICARKIR